MTRNPGGGAGLGDMRRANELAVLEELWRSSPRTRSDLASATGLTKPTVSAALVSLGTAGLVEAAGDDAPTAKYGGRLFASTGRQHPVLGLDIGARWVRAEVGGLDGGVLAAADQPVAAPTLDAVLAAARAVRDEVLATAGLELGALVGAGFGVPGVVDRDARVISLPGEIAGLERPGTPDLLRDLVPGVPVVFENDVNLAAVAEHRSGAGRELDDFALVSVGTGVGAALVLRGHLYRGVRGSAGEIDHLFARDSRPPQLRSPSAAALLEFAGEQHPGASLPALEQVFRDAELGDPEAAGLVEEAARRIAALCATVVSVIDVDTVVLAGGVGRALPIRHPVLLSEMERLVPWPTRIAPTAHGRSGTVIGARSIALEDTRQRLVDEKIGKSLYSLPRSF